MRTFTSYTCHAADSLPTWSGYAALLKPPYHRLNAAFGVRVYLELLVANADNSVSFSLRPKSWAATLPCSIHVDSELQVLAMIAHYLQVAK
jgi:hypothetical protein